MWMLWLSLEMCPGSAFLELVFRGRYVWVGGLCTIHDIWKGERTSTGKAAMSLAMDILMLMGFARSNDVMLMCTV